MVGINAARGVGIIWPQTAYKTKGGQPATPLVAFGKKVDVFLPKSKDSPADEGRRHFLMGGVAAGALAGVPSLSSKINFKPAQSNMAAPHLVGAFAPDIEAALTPHDIHQLQRILKPIEYRALQYFMDNRTPSGLVLDRVPLMPSKEQAWKFDMASIAATGYGLSAWILASEKGMLTKDKAETWTLQTLEFVDSHTPENQKGWLTRYLNAKTGAPLANESYGMNEVSLVDTALFYMNALAAASYYGGAVEQKVNAMLDKVDFNLMLTNGGTQPDKLAMSLGFRVDKNGHRTFLPYDVGDFSEQVLAPFLGLGSKTHPIPAKAWTQGWQAKRWHYDGKEALAGWDGKPLGFFTNFYMLGFLNLKGMKDAKGIDYWQMAKNTVEMQQAYCKANGYPDWAFGLSAAEGPTWYHAYAPGTPEEQRDHVIAPPAIIAALPFAPNAVLKALTEMEKLGLTQGEKAQYGIPSSYQPQTHWTSPDAFGIDAGSMLLMADAANREVIQKLIANNSYIQSAMHQAQLFQN